MTFDEAKIISRRILFEEAGETFSGWAEEAVYPMLKTFISAFINEQRQKSEEYLEEYNDDLDIFLFNNALKNQNMPFEKIFSQPDYQSFQEYEIPYILPTIPPYNFSGFDAISAINMKDYQKIVPALLKRIIVTLDFIDNEIKNVQRQKDILRANIENVKYYISEAVKPYVR